MVTNLHEVYCSDFIVDQLPPQPWYDPYTYKYNQGWIHYLELGYPSQDRLSIDPVLPQQPYTQTGKSLEELIRSFAANTLQFQQETRASLQSLEHQLSQLNSSISRLESQVTEDREDEEKEQELEMGLIDVKPIKDNSSSLPPISVPQDLLEQEPIKVLDLAMDETREILTTVKDTDLAVNRDCIVVPLYPTFSYGSILKVEDYEVACKEFNNFESPKDHEEGIKLVYINDNGVRVDFIIYRVKKEIEDKYMVSNYKESTYARSLTIIELSFLWYIDGYSDDLVQSRANDSKQRRYMGGNPSSF
ncbi:hypothetical protein ACH5RR_026016 [Cinchona calisaya]|uniref:Uncharacterized protein n=1 Tax=Cinchona calisaya TaxID=153742 RepID=A0ABD2Z1A7_9GENT